MDELQHQIEQHFPHLNAWQLFIAMAPSDASDPRTTHSIFQTLVQIGALKQFYTDLDLPASRLCSLLGYLVRYPNQRTAKYLGRVARCYVLDMPPELAVMARAALDVALEEVVPDDKVRDRLGIPARDRVGLSARLEYFKEMDLLKEPQTKNADLIKAAGDAAAHGKDRAFDPDQLLTALSAVLTAIDPFQPGPWVPA